MGLTIRAKLTLWYTGVLAAILVLFAGAVYVGVERRLSARRDAQLAESARALIYAFIHERAEHRELPTTDAVAVETIREFRFRDRHFAIYRAEGRLVALSDKPADVSAARLFSENPPSGAPVARVVAVARMGTPAFSDVESDGTTLRLHGAAAEVGADRYVIVVAGDNADQLEWLAHLRRLFWIFIPLALAGAAGGGYLLARKSFTPVMKLCAEADRLGAADLSGRLTAAQPDDELGRLAASFNGLLGRLAAAIESLRRFTSDASHELRTPVAIIQGESDVALARERSPEEYRESLAIIRDESRRMARVVEDLFTLTRADAGQLIPTPTRFDLGESVAECVRSLRTFAENGGIRLKSEVAEELPVRTDEALFRQLLRNLIENAVKYTPRGGAVTVRATPDGPDLLVHVADTGPGIPIPAQKHLFERFFRAGRRAADRQPTVGGGGAGLGLAISAEIARALGGDLKLTRSDAHGSVFTFRIRGMGAGEL
jgi:heavy metal sensor kinase